MFLFNNIFKKALLFIIIAETLSLWAHLAPNLNSIFFFIVLAIVVIVSFKKIEYGLYILLAELFIGSQGRLFSFAGNGLFISIRIGIFLVLISFFVFDLINKRQEYKKMIAENRFLYTVYFLLLTFIGGGAINGYLRGNTLANIFFDFNAWPYFLLLPLIMLVFNKRNEVYKLINIFLAALVALSFKALILLFIFSHSIPGRRLLYRWVRNSGVGEITNMGGGMYRIFFQAQIYTLVGFFIVLFLLYYVLKQEGWVLNLFSRKQYTSSKLFLVLSLVASSIFISLSRSFWAGFLGVFLLLIIFLIYILSKQKLSSRIFVKKIIQMIAVPTSSALAGVLMMMAIVYFPVGTIASNSTASLLRSRASALSGEAAVASRWMLLTPLWNEIKKTPMAGAGFGATVTYKSQDPRVLATHPDGNYETYAFEWGYLDIWLKIGIAGLIIYLLLLFAITRPFWADIRRYTQNNTYEAYLKLGFAAGLIALLIVNIFSPYLNHPLGIGYVMLCAIIIHFEE